MPRVRAATLFDISSMNCLIARAGVELSVGFYTPEQAQAVTRHVFGIDTQLIADGTYFVVEQDGKLVACGGWSRRRTLFGGDQLKTGADPLLDPACEAGRIRAFFVEPDMARRGLGRLLLAHCTQEALRAGFTALELMATLPGEPLYRAGGFGVVERIVLPLPGGIELPLTRMRIELDSPAVAPPASD